VRIALKSSFARWVMIAVESAVLLALVFEITKIYLAEAIAQRPTVEHLQLAARLDPGDSDYPLRLGLLSQYGLTDFNPDRGVGYLKRAIELNPYDPEPWLDLGAAWEFQAKTSQAEACLLRAASLAPNLPAYQYAIGDFFLLHGNVDEAFRHYKSVLAGSPQYDQILFDTAWKASGEASKILEGLIPHHVATEFSYLDYLLSEKRFEAAQNLWDRILESPEDFLPAQAGPYIDALIDARRPTEALSVWRDLVAKGLIRSRSTNARQNLLVNGDFEDNLINMGFDWRVSQSPGATIVRDQTTYSSPAHSLLIRFLGKQNVDFYNVFQYVKVQPGRRYRLHGLLKAEQITTDSGPRLAVHDAYDPANLLKYSEEVTGSTVSWTPVEVIFTPGSDTELISVGIARPPSHKLDNLITGRVWVDDLSLTELPGDATLTREK
jgi:tetratricopeptide (TPR) repeat protein